MTNRDEIEILNDRASVLWRRLTVYRERGEWANYWYTRHAWLATCRLIAALQSEVASATPEQLSLVPPSTGRAHDTAS